MQRRGNAPEDEADRTTHYRKEGSEINPSPPRSDRGGRAD